MPRAYLGFGFTSIVDLDLTPQDKSWFEGTPLHPHLYSCGGGVKVAGGYMAALDAHDYTPERAVSRAADSGAIFIKAFVESGFGVFNWPYLHTDTLQKIRTATKERNLVLIVHANSVDSWRSALDARAHIIAHGLWVWSGDPDAATPPEAADQVIARCSPRWCACAAHAPDSCG